MTFDINQPVKSATVNGVVVERAFVVKDAEGNNHIIEESKLQEDNTVGNIWADAAFEAMKQVENYGLPVHSGEAEIIVNRLKVLVGNDKEIELRRLVSIAEKTLRYIRD